MKIKIFFIVILFILLCLTPSYAADVDPALENELEADGEVSVIITLKNNQQGRIRKLSSIQNKRENIRTNQKRVLSNLSLRKKSKKARLGTLAPDDFDFELRHQYSTVNGFSGIISKKGLEKLKLDLNIESIVIDKPMFATLDASAPYINANGSWSLKLNGTNITGVGETVCVIDTGIDYTHAALGNGWGNKVIGGYRSLNQGADAVECESDTTACLDDYYHGTHVAGIVSSDDSTYVGVAPDAKLIAVKVLDSSGGGWTSDTIAGIDWCVNNASKYNISVITMSLGDCTNHSTYCNGDAAASSINNAVGQGIAVIVSAGNGPAGTCAGSGITNLDGPASPACVQNATAVGAVNTNDVISYQRGALFEIMAPGIDIISTKYPSGGFLELDGTSMAAPHVAGAAALLKQFVKLQNDTNITPQQIKDTLNNTGTIIDDSGNSGYNFSRIDIYSALLALDSNAPILQFTNSSPANNSFTQSNTTIINVTSNEILTSAWIEINDSNTTLNGSQTDWWINITENWGYSYIYTIWANDSAGNLGYSETRLINILNSIPETTPNISCSDGLNRTNGTLTSSWNYSDNNQDSQIKNETMWFNNTIELDLFRNLTIIGSGNTSRNQNWIFSVRVFDGTNWSSWQNTSITITNTAPEISTVKNISTVNETGIINITVNGTDIDNDIINYSINDSRFIQSNGIFTWQTNLSDSGTYTVKINASDGNDTVNQTFSITILDSVDFDGDQNPDFNDTDDDNDGFNDSIDKLTGNVTDISSSTTIKLLINGSENTTILFNETFDVNITDEFNNSIVNFNWNFTNSTLTLNWTIDYAAENGTILVKALDLSSQALTKTVYINKSTSTFNYVCIGDFDTGSISDVSATCTNSNETKLACSGSSGPYSCTDLGYNFKVTGLNHSAVMGIYVAPSNPGGGGGGGGSRKVTQTCTESWNCTSWKPVVCNASRRQYRICIDQNNCTTELKKPRVSQFCSYIEPEPVENITEEIVEEKTEIQPIEPEINETMKITPPEETKTNFKVQWIIIPIIIIILAVIILIVIKHHKKRIHKKRPVVVHDAKDHLKQHHKTVHHHKSTHHQTPHHKVHHKHKTHHKKHPKT